MLDKIQPQNIELEEAIIGCIISYTEAFPEASKILHEEAFYNERLRLIYRCCVSLNKAGRPIDILLIYDRLKISGELELVGGLDFLMELSQKYVHDSRFESWCRVIYDKYVLREMIRASIMCAQDAYNDTIDVKDLVHKQLYAVQKILSDAEQRSGESTKGMIANAVVKNIKDAADGTGNIYKATGLRDLDDLCMTVKGGELIVIAARTGVGKSMLCNVILNKLGLRDKLHIQLYSLEMLAEDYVSRLVSNSANIPYSSIIDGSVGLSDRLSDALDSFKESNIQIIDRSGISIYEVEANALSPTSPIDCIIIDHGGLMDHSVNDAESSVDKIGFTTMRLKLLALKLKIPIFLVWQLNRGADDSARPSIKHIRGSGRIEEDADKILLAHRPDMYYGHKDEDKGKIELLCVKHRRGDIGFKVFDFVPNFCRIEEFSKPFTYAKKAFGSFKED